jgi:hypothetical protein
MAPRIQPHAEGHTILLRWQGRAWTHLDFAQSPA